MQLSVEIKRSYPGTREFLFSFAIWYFLMLAYQLCAALATGALTLRRGELYLWSLWLRTIVPTLVIGVITVGCVFLFCRKLPVGLRVACAFLVGLMVPPLAGVTLGLINENYNYSLLGQLNGLQGWISGLVSAVPSGVAAAMALIGMRPARAPRG